MEEGREGVRRVEGRRKGGRDLGREGESGKEGGSKKRGREGKIKMHYNKIVYQLSSQSTYLSAGSLKSGFIF